MLHSCITASPNSMLVVQLIRNGSCFRMWEDLTAIGHHSLDGPREMIHSLWLLLVVICQNPSSLSRTHEIDESVGMDRGE
mmetsp:Transcript_26924/g.65414  ORF Transcript_26924/g.65414 Transcript_26924/m.65414 type:complete len:80 (+) Transcript_26924:684-923(+)